MSDTPLSERQAFVAARKAAALARDFKYDAGYEDALKVYESDPARFAAMSGNYRSAVLGYYLPAKLAYEAAEAAKTGGSR